MKIIRFALLISPCCFAVIIELIYYTLFCGFGDLDHAFNLIYSFIEVKIGNDFFLWEFAGLSQMRSDFCDKIIATLFNTLAVDSWRWALCKNKSELMFFLLNFQPPLLK